MPLSALPSHPSHVPHTAHTFHFQMAHDHGDSSHLGVPDNVLSLEQFSPVVPSALGKR